MDAEEYRKSLIEEYKNGYKDAIDLMLSQLESYQDITKEPYISIKECENLLERLYKK